MRLYGNYNGPPHPAWVAFLRRHFQVSADGGTRYWCDDTGARRKYHDRDLRLINGWLDRLRPLINKPPLIETDSYTGPTP